MGYRLLSETRCVYTDRFFFCGRQLHKIYGKGESIPLTNGVRGPYCKIQTKCFTLGFMAQAQSTQAINPCGKNEDP